MTTFSQVVDILVAESRRGDMLEMITTYVNATIRDVHFNRTNNSLIQFKSNLFEAQVVADKDERFVWPIERSHRFAKVAAVYYPDLGEYAVERNPQAMFQYVDGINTRHTWYRTGENLAFSGYGGTDAPIWIAWYEFPRRLQYYVPSARPATWSDEAEALSIATAYQASDESRATAIDLTTNWLLLRWPDLILEGGRAKIYKRLKDEVAMRAAYSAFESARAAMVASETYEGTVTYMR